MTRLLARVALAALGIGLGITAVLAMREATLSTHDEVDPRSTAVVEIRAETKGGEHGQTLDEMVDALLLACRLEVGLADLVSDVDHGDGRFTATFRPGLDETDQRQLRGCLEDWTIDHVRLDVLSIETG